MVRTTNGALIHKLQSGAGASFLLKKNSDKINWQFITPFALSFSLIVLSGANGGNALT